VRCLRRPPRLGDLPSPSGVAPNGTPLSPADGLVPCADDDDALADEGAKPRADALGAALDENNAVLLGFDSKDVALLPSNGVCPLAIAEFT
jgi:hypothetical protein